MIHVIPFDQLTNQDVPKVGGKNASLGEMLSHLKQLDIKVPGGFATTADAYRDFLQKNQLDQKIHQRLQNLDVDHIQNLTRAGKQIRQWIEEAPFPEDFEQSVRDAYQKLTQDDPHFTVAVRSSATAEDLPDASFAGQQETFLNIRGIEHVLSAIKKVFASLFNDRAISYRVHKNFDHSEVALSAGIQQMVRSDLAVSGVMFSIDTESGFDQVVFITAAYGLGETVVQGAVNPDEYVVYKPNLRTNHPAILRRNLGSKAMKMVFSQQQQVGKTTETIAVSAAEQQRFCLTDQEVTELAKKAVTIAEHYGMPMDIEWGRDGQTGELYILQARPETVKSRETNQQIERYVLDRHVKKQILVQGRSIGQKIGAGKVRVVRDIGKMDSVQSGDVLVADMTDPDWEPVMKRASAIVTNRGGRTCHAAIIARELGIPAVVGTNDATDVLQDGAAVTVSCAEGETGYIYAGILDFEHKVSSVTGMAELPFKIMMNVGNPDRAFSFAGLPNEGIGLARLEFMINRMIGVHPKALLEFDQLDAEIQEKIRPRITGYASPVDFYIDRLAEGIAVLGAAFSPKRVIVRLSDFKSNEYANLIGGAAYEPKEENPMLGFRGASRYIADSFRDCFALECAALKKVRDDMHLTNVEIMIPFVRTLSEAEQVISLLKQNGLERGVNGLKVIMMCELPSNALLAEQFLEYFDGFSIGSNDLTQLTLGLDRDSGLIAHLFDERNPAVKALLHQAIQTCRKKGKYVGICGQGPSDHPDFAKWLMDEGIDSVSLNPDSVLDTWMFLADRNH